METLILEASHDFKIIRIKDQGFYWVGVWGKEWIPARNQEVTLCFFWSPTSLPAETGQLSTEAVIADLRERIHQASSSVREALTYWPKGWNFLGGGIPEPIADTIDFEIRPMLQDRKVEQNVSQSRGCGPVPS